MITPSSTSATMLSAVCETRVPSRTGNVSRIRPARRARTIARAGSPTRAGRVADIRTPIIVAEVTSRRRSRRPGSAALAIASHDTARRHIAAIIRPSAISTQFTSERTMLAMTLATPILLAASAVKPRPATPATPRPTRRATRRAPAIAVAGSGSSAGSRRGRCGGEPSIGITPVRRATASGALTGAAAPWTRSYTAATRSATCGHA